MGHNKGPEGAASADRAKEHDNCHGGGTELARDAEDMLAIDVARLLELADRYGKQYPRIASLARQFRERFAPGRDCNVYREDGDLVFGLLVLVAEAARRE